MKDIEEDSDGEEAGLSLEDQIAKEISSMKRPRRGNSDLRFGKHLLCDNSND